MGWQAGRPDFRGNCSDLCDRSVAGRFADPIDATFASELTLVRVARTRSVRDVLSLSPM